MIWWGDIGTERTTHCSDYKLRRKRIKWLQTALWAQVRGEIRFFKSRLGWTTNHRKSPLAISKWRCFGNNKGQQQRAQIGGDTAPFSRLRGEPENSNNSTSRRPLGGCDQPATARGDLSGGRTVSCSFLPRGYAVHCMLCCAFFCFAFLQFPLLSYRVLKAKQITRSRWERSGHANQRNSFWTGHGSLRFLIQKGTVVS